MTEKEKYLASAQKHVLKGSLERAIKDYEQLVALDPQDLRHRQRLAELLVRVNRKDEAVREFETIGRFYADNAYYLKSIAVYKQIQKLTPHNMLVSLLLAELNEKQGLNGNALAEYHAVVLTHEKSGEYGDAARVLDRIIALDPENVASHLKLAEVNLLANFRERAYREFLRTAILQNQFHDDAGFSHVCERVREVFPERTNFFVDLAEEQMRNGKADEAALFLQALLESDDTNLTAWFLLAEAYEACGDCENVKDTYGRMTILFPSEPMAREKYISCLIAEEYVETALTQLESCLTFFPSEQIASLEKHFQKIIELTPFNLRPFLGLRDLYEKCGELDKLAEVEGKLEILRKSRTAEVEESRFDRFSSEEVNGADAEIVAVIEAEPEIEAEGEDEVKTKVETEEVSAVAAASMPEMHGAATASEPSVEVAFSWEEDLDLMLEESLAENDGFGQDTDFLDVHIELPSEQAPAEEPYQADEALDDLFASFISDVPDTLPQKHAASEPKPTVQAKKPTGKYSFDGQFSAFKKIVDSQVDREDTETHYNLGIAYKEMGLYRDALEEFRFAARTQQRRIDALLLQGVCYRESGEPERARELLLSVLEEGGLSLVESASIMYELALLAEGENDREEACRFYLETQAHLPDFRDVIARMTLIGCVMVEDADDVEEAELEEMPEE